MMEAEPVPALSPEKQKPQAAALSPEKQKPSSSRVEIASPKLLTLGWNSHADMFRVTLYKNALVSGEKTIKVNKFT